MYNGSRMEKKMETTIQVVGALVVWGVMGV